jgi:hypothetical protein
MRSTKFQLSLIDKQIATNNYYLNYNMVPILILDGLHNTLLLKPTTILETFYLPLLL